MSLKIIWLMSRTGFVSALFTGAAFLFSGCGTEDKGGAGAARLLERAEYLAGFLRTDPTVQSEYLARISSAWLEKGNLGRAAAVMETIPNWRKSEMRARLALEGARRGRKDDAIRQLEKTRQESGVQGEWRRERILAACVEPLLALRMDSEAAMTREAIQEDRQRRMAWMGTVRGLAERGDFEGANAAIGEMAGGFSLEGAPLRAEASLLLAKAAKEKGDRVGARAHVDAAVKYAEDAKSWTEGTVLAAIARLSVELGDTEGAWRLAERFAGLAEALSPVAEWKAGWLLEAAELYRTLGKEERFRDLVGKAIEAVKGLPDFERVCARVGLGNGLNRLGCKEDALREWSLAVSAAQAHPHYRTRVLAALDMLLFAATEGQDAVPILVPHVDLLAKNLPEPEPPWMRDEGTGRIDVISVPPAKGGDRK